MLDARIVVRKEQQNVQLSVQDKITQILILVHHGKVTESIQLIQDLHVINLQNLFLHLQHLQVVGQKIHLQNHHGENQNQLERVTLLSQKIQII